LPIIVDEETATRAWVDACRKEAFAESFALEWAIKLNELPPKREILSSGEKSSTSLSD
jgi:hypothetical protein